MNILSIDIGGTYSRAAVFSGLNENALKMTSVDAIRVSTSAFNSFEDLITHITQSFSPKEYHYDSIVIAVPGPVEKNKQAELVNVSWKHANIEKTKNNHCEIILINDFVAQAFACLSKQMNKKIIKNCDVDKMKGICVVGAGTGLGHATLQFIDNKYLIIPSEAGQVTYPFDIAEVEYQKFLIHTKKLHDTHITNDHVVSGSGLLLLHEFLTGEKITAEEIQQKIPLDSETTHYFARLYARSCRNYALSLLDAFSSLYITGGVALKSPFLVDNDSFRKEFVNSPSKAAILQTIPIYVNQSDFMGLWGGALYGLLRQNQQLYGVSL